MITTDKYLSNVLSMCKSPDAVRSLEACLPSIERMQNIREMMEAWAMDASCGRDGLLEIYPLSEAKKALTRPNFNVCNWHYDRTTQTLLINLERGVHEHLSAALYQCFVEGAYSGFCSIKEQERLAEKFVEEGLGWFKSTASFGRALKGKSVKLSSQEIAVFGNEFMEM